MGLRRKCISILTDFIPLTLDELDDMQIALKEAGNDILTKAMTRVILLAQEMDVAEVLPFSYYIVTTRINPKRLLVDGAADLSWRDKTTCMVAREKLRVAWKESYAWLHSFRPSRECQQRQECPAAKGLLLRWSQVKKAVEDDPLLPFSQWKTLGVCQPCRDHAMLRYTSARNHLWKQLPPLFKLPLKTALKSP
jgi:hypothetical protein